MSALIYIGSAWLLVACAFAPPIGRGLRRVDERQQRQP